MSKSKKKSPGKEAGQARPKKSVVKSSRQTASTKKASKRLLNKEKASFRTKLIAAMVAFSFIAYLVIGSVTTIKGCGEVPSSEVDTAHQKAIDQIKAKLDLEPENIDLITGLGNGYYDWGLDLLQIDQPDRAEKMFKQAIGFYQRTLKVNPTNTAVRTDMSNAYYYTKQFDKSVEELNLALQADTSFTPAWYNLGYRHFEKENYSEAIKAWERFLALEPQGETAERVKAMLAEARQKVTP